MLVAIRSFGSARGGVGKGDGAKGILDEEEGCYTPLLMFAIIQEEGE